MKSKSKILPVESDHADAARYAIEHKRMEQALQESERRYCGLVEMSREAVLIHSDDKLTFVSDAAVELFGASTAEQLLGKSFLDFVHPKDRNIATSRIGKLAAQDRSAPFVRHKLIRIDGTRFDAEVAASRCSHGGKPAVQLVVRDVTERKWLDTRLSYLSQYDVLTELPNRTQFRDRLGGAIARASRNQQEAATVFLDLDHFKRVNTALGQATGDLVLKELAERLKHGIREGDTVARLGGDEFSLVLEGVSDKHGAAVVGQRLLEAVSLPVLIDLPMMGNDHIRIHRTVTGDVANQFGVSRLLPIIRNDIRLAEAFAAGKPIRYYAPKSRAAEDFAQLGTFLAQLCRR